jgi:aminopeptidase N
MTDRANALQALVVSGHPLAPALARFHALFKHEALVIDKWFALQAGSPTAMAAGAARRAPAHEHTRTSTSATPTARAA